VLEIDVSHYIVREMESKQYWRNDFRNDPEIFGTRIFLIIRYSKKNLKKIKFNIYLYIFLFQ
jgi:hypothetical protein